MEKSELENLLLNNPHPPQSPYTHNPNRTHKSGKTGRRWHTIRFSQSYKSSFFRDPFQFFFFNLLEINQ